MAHISCATYDWSSRPNPLLPQRQLLCLREGGNMISSEEDDEHDRWCLPRPGKFS
jgi:hypothetical protein